MFVWFIQRRIKGKPISDQLLIWKALEMNQKLGGEAY